MLSRNSDLQKLVWSRVWMMPFTVINNSESCVELWLLSCSEQFHPAYARWKMQHPWSNISCLSVQKDYVFHSRQPTLKTFQKVDVGQSSGKGALFPARHTKALELLAVHRQGSLGRAHIHIGFVTLFFPSSLSPQNSICFDPMLLCMCDLGECMETWGLNFVGNTDLLFWHGKTPFTALLRFQ